MSCTQRTSPFHCCITFSLVLPNFEDYQRRYIWVLPTAPLSTTGTTSMSNTSTLFDLIAIYPLVVYRRRPVTYACKLAASKLEHQQFVGIRAYIVVNFTVKSALCSGDACSRVRFLNVPKGYGGAAVIFITKKHVYVGIDTPYRHLF